MSQAYAAPTTIPPAAVRGISHPAKAIDALVARVERAWRAEHEACMQAWREARAEVLGSPREVALVARAKEHDRASTVLGATLADLRDLAFAAVYGEAAR